MDCEKYEPLLLDELYDELDEVTSAAVKRHVAGCARCASVLNGMKGTRQLIALPLEPVPVGLEDRIMSAAREAQKVVPLQSRFSRAVSIAGRWAMRPQTAMAAVFLLMIGSSALLLRARKDAAPRAMSVTMEGAPEPVAQVAATDTASLNTPAANNAHGTPPPVIAATPPPAASASGVAIALNDPSSGPMDRLTGGAARDDLAKDKQGEALGNALVAKEEQEGRGGGGKADAEKKTAPKPATRTADITNACVPGGVAGADYDGNATQVAAAPPPQAAPYAQAQQRAQGQDGYSAGQAAYRARNYGEATKQFDSAAQGGDQNAALWAAIAVRDGSGCTAALSRFDAVAKKAAGTYTGNEADLDAAKCQIATGNYDAARARLNRLAQTSTHAQQAQQALGELATAQRAKQSGSQSGGSYAAPRATAAPAKAPVQSDAPAQSRSGF